jgi:hypothetical protein
VSFQSEQQQRKSFYLDLLFVGLVEGWLRGGVKVSRKVDDHAVVG